MALYLSNGEKTLIEFQTELPVVLSYPGFPGSQVLAYRTSSLQLLIRELVSDFFIIRYNEFRFFKNQVIEAVSQKKGMHSRVMLQGGLHYSVEELGNFHQEEGSVSMIWSESAHCRALFEKDKPYTALDFYISPELVSQLNFFFPELLPELQTRPSRILLRPCFMTPSVRDIVTNILECPYDEPTSRFYYDLKVREYLFVLLEQVVRPGKAKYRFTPYEAGQIEKARDILLADVSKPPLTIRQLARQVGMNEFKLKAGFRHFYKLGVFETFQQARMEKAKQLLLHTNKPIKDICTLAGYPRMTNFITAFRKYFGFTPGSLRRS